MTISVTRGSVVALANTVATGSLQCTLASLGQLVTTLRYKRACVVQDAL